VVLKNTPAGPTGHCSCPQTPARQASTQLCPPDGLCGQPAGLQHSCCRQQHHCKHSLTCQHSDQTIVRWCTPDTQNV